MPYPRKKLLTMTCAKCLKEHDTLAWFQSTSSMYNDSALCRKCFKEQFNKLSETEKGQWGFYDTNNLKKSTNTRGV